MEKGVLVVQSVHHTMISILQIDYPPKEYGHFVREKVLEWYKNRSLDMLERTYIQHNADGLMDLQLEFKSCN